MIINSPTCLHTYPIRLVTFFNYLLCGTYIYCDSHCSHREMASKGPPKVPKPKSNEEIVAGFQALRSEQRRLANKLGEIEADKKEHQIVIEALKQMSGERKAFRLLGGVLTERTVAAVLPELQDAFEKLPDIITALEAQLRSKGSELAAYVAEHNLRISQDEPPAPEPAPPPMSTVLVTQ